MSKIVITTVTKPVKDAGLRPSTQYSNHLIDNAGNHLVIHNADAYTYKGKTHRGNN